MARDEPGHGYGRRGSVYFLIAAGSRLGPVLRAHLPTGAVSVTTASVAAASVAVGDEIRTIGGIIGRIVAQDDSTYTIQLDGSRMRITKRAVAERVEGDAE